MSPPFPCIPHKPEKNGNLFLPPNRIKHLESVHHFVIADSSSTALNFSCQAYGIITEVRIMSGYKVEICGVNTAKLPLLSNEEKEELFQRILDGDMEAREQYIKGNLRLVAQRNPALFKQPGKHRRPVPDWMHRPNQGHRQF